MAEERVEAVTEEGKEQASEEPSEEGKETKYNCSLCGAVVVPERVQTPTGIRYKCPECKKFMKPLTKEEVKKEEERGPLPPTEVEMTDRVKEILAKELPRVYGIPRKESSKRIDAILDTLSPAAATDPWNLHNHIKNFAPNADDRHLESIINKVFWQLEEEGYIPKEQEYEPRYGRRSVFPRRGYQPRYAPRERGLREHYYEEDYDDYDEPVRRRSRMKVVVDGQEIETDFEGYMAWQRFKREEGEEKQRTEEHELAMKKLEAEIKKITEETGGSKNTEPLVKVKVGEEAIEVPASIAPLYLKGDDKTLKDMQDKLEKEREERHKAEMQRLEEKIDNQPSFIEQLQAIQQTAPLVGYQKGGRTTLDILDSIGERIDERAGQLLNKMPTPGGEFKPEVTRTPEERRRTAETIKKRLEKSEEILTAEDELMKAASKVRI